MIVYRVENEFGEGPYTACGIFLDDWSKRTHCFPNHPTIWDDSISRSNKIKAPIYDYSCGFDSEEQLFNWFNKSEIKNLKRIGFDIVKINVHAAHVLFGTSGKQIMFRKSKIKGKEIL